MASFSQEFKVQSVEKALSRHPDQTLKSIADHLGGGYSTLQKWLRLAKNNQLERPENIMSKEKSPLDWNKTQSFLTRGGHIDVRHLFRPYKVQNCIPLIES